ncbi:exodeoxyribonuclease VII small subunit [Parolsenella catena]|uniref:exodeoxyribonuclease VII small subunit n=1 Tax=Parolsenella catena TaxID=2003188 RepID=UPI00319E2864
MAKAPDTSGYERFSDVTARLDEIIADVRKKDTSLERSLDLFDEAIALGTRAVDLVDKAAFSPEERERLAEPVSGENADEGEKATGEFEAKGAVEHASADSADEAK